MSTITSDQVRTAGTAPVLTPQRGPVMLATDGPPPSDVAVRTASRLAHRLGVPLARINVLHPMPALHPAAEINELAREQHVSIIVVDHGEQGILHRLAGDDISLEVVRGGHTPVYAVDAHEPAQLRRVVVAVDFSAASIRAAQLAVALVGPPAEGDDAVVSLLHVNPGFDGSAATYEAWAADYEKGTARMFEALRAMLRPHLPGGVLLETRITHGLVFDCIRDTAIELEADLIALGTRSAGWLDRMLVGSVATDVLRHVRRSVLVVPPPPAAEREQLERVVTGGETLL